jgi:hypothetical protein
VRDWERVVNDYSGGERANFAAKVFASSEVTGGRFTMSESDPASTAWRLSQKGALALCSACPKYGAAEGVEPHTPLLYTATTTMAQPSITAYRNASSCGSPGAAMTLGSSSARLWITATTKANTCMSTNTPACQVPSPEFSCSIHEKCGKDCWDIDWDIDVCTYRKFAETLCVSLDELNLWRPNGGCYSSRTKSGSFYTYGIKHATAAPLEVQLRSAKDPFIAAQRITKGTMDFGLPAQHDFTDTPTTVFPANASSSLSTCSSSCPPWPSFPYSPSPK